MKTLRPLLLSPDSASGGSDPSAALQAEIAALRQKIATLETENAGLMERLTAPSPGKSASPTSVPQDVLDKLVADITQKVQTEAAKAIESHRRDSAAKIEELQTLLRQRDLEVIRNRLITEAGGPDALVAPDLIQGDSEDAIKAAIEKSKAEYQRIVARLSSSGVTPLPGGAPRSPAAPPVPPVPSVSGKPVTATGGEIPGAVRQSVGDWKANREKVLASVRARYEGPSRHVAG